LKAVTDFSGPANRFTGELSRAQRKQMNDRLFSFEITDIPAGAYDIRGKTVRVVGGKRR